MDPDADMEEHLTVEAEMKDRLHQIVDERVENLYSLWSELGLDDKNKRGRNATIEKHFIQLLDQMVEEEFVAKKKILDSLELHTKKAVKLSKELGLTFTAPDSCLVLVQYEQAVRHEANRLGDIKEERMKEAKALKRKDEQLCDKLDMEPFYVCLMSTVPSTEKLDGLKEHIKMLEELRFTRLEQLLKMRDNILQMYSELETEPVTELEREIACEDPDKFTLSASNLAQVSSILNSLEERRELNKKMAMGAVEKLHSLYDRLKLKSGDKFKFLSEHEGHKPSVIGQLHLEIKRLEEIKKANIEKFVTALRSELDKLWDDCFYSQEQRNKFQYLKCEHFTEEILEVHEAELDKLKAYYEENKELLGKVGQWQEVWRKAMELERRAKDPSRLMNARGNSLLKEEKERNKVNRTLPRLEQELKELIRAWEKQHGKTFLVGGVSFTLYLQQQREAHTAQLEAEKKAKEQAKKKTLHQETMFGAKPATPVKLRTPRKAPRTPLMAQMRERVMSPRAARPQPKNKKSTLTVQVGGVKRSADETFRLNKSSKMIKKGKSKATAAKNKLRRSVLADQTNSSLSTEDTTDTIIKSQSTPESLASTVPDYADFKAETPLNSTVKEETLERKPNYMTPTKSSIFKTPVRAARSRARTPQSTNKLATVRSGSALPFLF